MRLHANRNKRIYVSDLFVSAKKLFHRLLTANQHSTLEPGCAGFENFFAIAGW